MAEQLAGLNKEYNNPLEWTYLDSKSGLNTINLPTSYNELMVVVEYSNVIFTGIIPASVTGASITVNGYFALVSGGNYYGGSAAVNKTSTTIWLHQVFVNNSEVETSSTITVYYR